MIPEGPEGVTRARTLQVVPTWLVVVVLVVVGALLPFVVAARFGTIGIPRGDDVAYVLSAFRFADDGHLTGSAWAGMNLVGQLVAASPVVLLVGHRITALQLEIAVLAPVGLFAVYDLARRLTSSRRALFAALVVAATPLWIALVPTFYTDVPAFTAGMASLALGARGLVSRDQGTAWLVGAVGVGLVGFTVREFVLVAPIAVCLAYLAHPSRHGRRTAAAVGLGVVVVLAAGFSRWHSGLDGFVAPELGAFGGATVRRTATRVGQSAVMVGLFLTPALVLANPMRIVRQAWRRGRAVTIGALATVVVVVVGAAVIGGRSGDFMAPDRIATNQWTIGPGYRALVPAGAANVFVVIGVGGLLLLVCAAIPAVLDRVTGRATTHDLAGTSPVRLMVVLAALGSAAVPTLISLLGAAFFPRYLLPLVALLSVLVLGGVSANATATTTATRRCAAATLAALGVAGFAAAAVNASLEGAAWAVSERAARQLPDAELVDGGFDWNNWRSGQMHRIWYHPPGACVRVGLESGPGASDDVVERERVFTIGGEVWVVARQDGACPGDDGARASARKP